MITDTGQVLAAAGFVADRIAAVIDGLGMNPRPMGSVKLAGRDDFGIRVGDYRIVYAVDDAAYLVIIARIAHRRDASFFQPKHCPGDLNR